MSMVPFFVVDRPISLKILKGIKLSPGQKIGLMAHANTSENFRAAFCAYPKDQTIKMCDSAIFHAEANTYEELFTKYEEMGADYGVIIDVLRDAKATIKSARKALQVYDPEIHHFKLVAVAQGTTVREYLECYKKLREMGYTHIAVGGLLQKRERSVRYMNVRDEKLMREVLRRIRKEFNPEWLFALGCLRASRYELFKELNVWGDYKGWIFEYKKRDETLHNTIERFSTNHLSHAPLKFRTSVIGIKLKTTLWQRQKALAEQKDAHKKLLTAKRAMQDFFTEIYSVLIKKDAEAAKILLPLKSRGVLQENERELAARILHNVGLQRKNQTKLILLSNESRKKKDKFLRAEAKVNATNVELLSLLKQVQSIKSGDKNIKSVAAEMVKVLGCVDITT